MASLDCLIIYSGILKALTTDPRAIDRKPHGLEMSPVGINIETLSMHVSAWPVLWNAHPA